MDNTELYKQVINDHFKNPYKMGKLKEYTHFARGENSNKGDCIEVFLLIKNNSITNCSFIGEGGAVFTASASLMMELIFEKSIENAINKFNLFRSIFDEKNICEDDSLEKLVVFKGIKQFPARVKCASLPWFTMKGAIENINKIVSTELII